LRVIKFRAWSKAKKEVVEIDGIRGDMGFKTTGGYDLWYESEFVMQYIGANDKNGKGIYEGDIVKESQSIGKIIFDDGCFIIEWIRNKDFFDDILAHHVCWLKVVGNIYETPLLVE